MSTNLLNITEGELLTSFQHQVTLHRLKAEGFNSAAHHGVPHYALVAVDVHQAVVPRNLAERLKKTRTKRPVNVNVENLPFMMEVVVMLIYGELHKQTALMCVTSN